MAGVHAERFNQGPASAPFSVLAKRQGDPGPDPSQLSSPFPGSCSPEPRRPVTQLEPSIAAPKAVTFAPRRLKRARHKPKKQQDRHSSGGALSVTGGRRQLDQTGAVANSPFCLFGDIGGWFDCPES